MCWFHAVELESDCSRHEGQIRKSKDEIYLPENLFFDGLKLTHTYADACLDRIIHKAFRLEMNGKNMRNPS